MCIRDRIIYLLAVIAEVGFESYDSAEPFFLTTSLVTIKLLAAGSYFIFIRGFLSLGQLFENHLLRIASYISIIFVVAVSYTHLADAKFLAPMSLIYNEENPYRWSNFNIKVYAQLRDGVTLEEASEAIKDIMKPHRDPEDGPMELFLIPMKDWHLNACLLYTSV